MRITREPGVTLGRQGTAIITEHSFSINHFVWGSVQNYHKLRFKEYQSTQNLISYCKENGQTLTGGPHGQDQERNGSVNSYLGQAQNNGFLGRYGNMNSIETMIGSPPKPLRCSCSVIQGDVLGL